MKKILGLDLGVSSIGWAFVNEADKNNEESSIIRLGVRVTPLTVDEQINFEKGKSITTNADRTQKRGMRRNLQRYKLRRENLIACLKENGIIDNDDILCENGNKTTFETYRLRAKAATEQVPLDAFARILMMINKKRGYKSSRKTNSTEEGDSINGMIVAQELYDNDITPGQYIYRRLQQNKKYIPDFYSSDLKNEFNRIYAFQQAFYPDILTEKFLEAITEKSNNATYAIFKYTYNIIASENKGTDKKLQMYRLRNDAIQKQLPIEDVASVLCELNRLINNSSGYLGTIGDRSKELYFSKQTIGQTLMKRLENNPNASLKNIVYYRQDYLDEFETIWETQRKYYKQLTPELKKEIRDIIIFYQRSLKSQKNLVSLCEFEKKDIDIIADDGKNKKKTIGRRVCPKSSPLFQEFKIWQILNNIIVENTRTNERRFLNIDEKRLLANELNCKDKLKKSEALRLLFTNHKELDINYKELEGNRTAAAIIKACLEIVTATGHNEYNSAKLNAENIHDIIERIFKALGYKTDYLKFNSSSENIEQEPMYRLWHLLYSYVGDNSKTGDDSLVKKISQLTGISDDYARIIAKITLPSDYGSLSSKAIRRILPHMQDGNDYSVACAYAGYNHSESLNKEQLALKEYKQTLEPLPKNSLRNPVVEKILNQMINVVNCITEEYGKPDEIRIELARELKSSAKERENMTAGIIANNKENDEIRGILRSEFKILNPSRNDIVRYKLYTELKTNGFRTLYSNTYIPQEELFSNKFDIEHIIPQAKLFDDSLSNKTLEARDTNIEKGNKTAYDYIADKYDKNYLSEYIARVEKLYKSGAIKKSKRDKLLMKIENLPQDFINRDLRDTQYIAKKAREILETIVPFVVPTTGRITDRLREDWQLTNIMQELNWSKYEKQGYVETYLNREGKEIKRIKEWTKRNDHRHHAMDALTIAFTGRNIIQYLNNLNVRSDKSGSIYAIEQKELERDSHGKLRFKLPFKNFREEARRQMEDILVSIKSKSKVATRNTNKIKVGKNDYKEKIQLTPRGQLHLESIFGCSKRYVTNEEKIGSSFTAEHIALVANKREREALLRRLNEFDGDAKKAFTGKNSLDKNPIYLDKEKKVTLPAKVKIVKLESIYTIRKNIDKTLNIEKVVDVKIKKLLKERLKQYGNNASAAFSNLDENPIWLNKEKGIKIKRVTICENGRFEPLHDKKDHKGNTILTAYGHTLPADFVSTGNNHHVAIYIDENGNLQENIVTFYDATARALNGLSIIDKEYNSYLGWKFLFSMKQNDYFVFPNEKTGFNPEEIDLKNPKNNNLISPNLFRVQKLSSKDYVFRHHLETTVEDKKELKGITWKRITALQNLRGIVKVRVNHIGKIVDIGEL